jgi:pimeloyl-ACP methyl ester carboxylesterase
VPVSPQPPLLRPGSGGATGVGRATVIVRGEIVEYQRVGEGPPVVLLHGLAGSVRWWGRNVRALAQHHTVYLVNLPGFGAFRRQGQPFVLQEAADWLADWLTAVQIAPAHVVAHSMGGFLTLRLAARQPGLIQRTVLVGPAGVPHYRSLPRFAWPIVAAGLAASPSFMPILALDSLRAGPRTLLRAARELIAEDIRDDLRAVTVPTLLVWGSRDPLVPPSLGPLMRRELPDARLLLLPGAGHVAQYDRHQEFNAAALAFLSGESVGE